MSTPPPYYGPPAGEPYGPPPGGGQQNGQGLTGMILGIVSLPLACCPYLGFVVAVVGIVFSWLGLKKAQAGLANNGSQAKTGLICASVGVVLAVVFLILGLVLRQFDWQTYLENNSN